MKKVVISGSAKLQNKIKVWIEHFKSKKEEIIAFPKQIKSKEELSKEYKEFYLAIEICNVFFLMNEEKDGIKGYIGANGIAELTYAIMLNLIHNKEIEIYIMTMPSKEVTCYDEIKFYLNMGWIKIYDEHKRKKKRGFYE